MINCTNIGYSWAVITNSYWEWPSGSPGGGIYRRPEGVVEVEGKATVWIEDTALGRLVGTQYSHGGIKPGYLNTATIINSSIQEVRVRSQTPLRIIDSEIHELYADEGDIELIGTTKVTYLFPFLKRDEWFPDRGRGPDIAYRASIRGVKKEYQLHEPINITFRVENLGFQPLTLHLKETDKFVFRVYWYNESSTYDDGVTHNSLGDRFICQYHPDQSALLPQVVIEPGKTTEFNLTWPQDPRIPPGHYWLECSVSGATLGNFKVGNSDFIIYKEE